MKKTKKYYIKSTVFILILIILDQITKYLAYHYLRLQKDAVWIKNVFVLHYLENTSAAFSLDPVTLLNRIFHFKVFKNPIVFLKAKMTFFVILTIIVLIIIYCVYVRIPNTKRAFPMNFMLELFFAGSIGNCIDRIIHNYVIDFFYFELINFPVFNVADIYVTIAAFAFIFLLLFYYKEQDFETVFPKKDKKNKE